MSGVPELLTFAGVMALGQFSPGPDMVLLTRTALKGGAKAGVEMALGIACGLAVHATVAVAGLALAFESVPRLGEVMRWAAAGYLLWLAWRMVREQPGSPVQENASSRAVRRPFTRGLLCNLLNPKAAIFLAAASAPFLRGTHPDWWPLALWMIVVGQAGLLWALWAYLLQWPALRLRYEGAERRIDLVFALVLAALAVRLMVG